MSHRQVPRPRGLEILANLMLGPDENAPRLPPPEGGGARAALERVLVEALSRPPCLVSFSGGRDSSAVLALAVAAARRHGLAMPVPAIMRFPGAPASHEAEWQRAVLDHLSIREAEVLELGDELDALGSVATAVLGRHGLLWPGNAYMHRPVLELARGGTLLTGIGGDELFSTRAPRRPPHRRLLGALPAPLRRSVWRARRPSGDPAWLTPSGRRRVRRAVAREEVGCPYPWDEALRYWYGGRGFAALDGSLSVVASDLGVTVVNPLLDPAVLAELAAAGGPRGFSSRSAAMEWLCGDLLPRAVLYRVTKAGFGGAVWGPRMREFAAGGSAAITWEGAGIDPGDIDQLGLRAELRRPEPDFRTILLLQQGWLSAQATPSAASSVSSS